MVTYPLDLAQEAACQSHISRLTGLWLLPNQPKGLSDTQYAIHQGDQLMASETCGDVARK